MALRSDPLRTLCKAVITSIETGNGERQNDWRLNMEKQESFGIDKNAIKEERENWEVED